MPLTLQSDRLTVYAGFQAAKEVFQEWDVGDKAVNHDRPLVSTLKKRSIKARSA